MTQPAAPPRQPLLLPKIITTFQEGYRLPDLIRDSFAGLTVAIVALPLALAIAIASGVEPGIGLTTVIVAGLAISMLGGSRTQIGGPTAAFIVVVYGVVRDHGVSGLVTATFLAGLILIAAAFLRVGSLIRYVPEPVIRGFTVGIGVVIAFSQIQDVLGLTGKVPAEFFARLSALWAVRDTFSPASLGIAALTLAIIIGFRRYAPRFPGMVVAVGVASLLVVVFGLQVDTIGSRFGELAGGLPMPRLPDLSPQRLAEMLPSAFIIAFLAGIESLLSAMVADKMSGGRHRPNSEVLAQGVANAASALFGGLPATGAIARTATNIRAGGKTPVAGVVHALVVLVFVLVAAPLVSYFALPSLAAILLLTAWNMSEPHRLGEDLRGRREDILVMLLTFGLTVLVDLTTAISVGLAVSFALRFRRRQQPPPDWHTPQT
ncbi:MAG TPA: SulP family inorganic anion transporter [Devosiaceae bacterium]